MELVFLFAILFYMLSTAAYLAYLFLQKGFIQKTAGFILFAGFFLHTLFLAAAAVKSSSVPVNNLHETLAVTGWAVALVFFVFHLYYKVKILGIYAAPMITIIMLAASQMPRTPLQHQAVLKSSWLAVHIITVFLGDAALAMAFGIGILYLLQEHSIKTKKRGFFYSRLPSLDLLDTAGYASIITGFSLLTFGLVTGAVYAKSIWGHFWSWDPKEVWSAITWVFYLALLHERLSSGLRGRRAAIMAIIGFAVLLFTFFGVNFLLKGHHGQFTAG